MQASGSQGRLPSLRCSTSTLTLEALLCSPCLLLPYACPAKLCITAHWPRPAATTRLCHIKQWLLTACAPTARPLPLPTHAGAAHCPHAEPAWPGANGRGAAAHVCAAHAAAANRPGYLLHALSTLGPWAQHALRAMAVPLSIKPARWQLPASLR